MYIYNYIIYIIYIKRERKRRRFILFTCREMFSVTGVFKFRYVYNS